MRFAVFTLFALTIFSCTKKETTPSISLEGTSWNWVSTTNDSTFFEDTSSSANSQRLTFVDYKTFDWKRNDTAFASGTYLYKVKQSVLFGKKKFIMNFAGVQTPFVMTRNIDTLWLQEDKATGGVRYRFFKN
ncbi:hypothetical protein [Fluviicola sp.]|uniref:hypothetical protein n=1 Tax=Fluviicola sp. TaxID=1917219 RepID=UPI00260D0A7C|nr:hypothetical protein [Fluviicola sp.]